MPTKTPFVLAEPNAAANDRHEWLMDVMSDLRQYARINEMPALADQLENALLICAVEMENAPRGAKRSMMRVA